MQLVDTHLDDRGVFTITLSDEAKRNALSRALTAELVDAMNRVDTEDDIRVAVITNTGSVFCAGADLSERSAANTAEQSPGETEFEAAKPVRTDPASRNAKRSRQQPSIESRQARIATAGGRSPGDIDPLALFRRIQDSPKPWVGRIAGHAVAGGTGLAAALDISVAHKDAKFGFTEVRLGVAPAIISVICLPKMRRGEATAVFLRGQRFDGTEAARLGLITMAVDPEDLDAEVDAIISDLLLGGPLALAAAKDVLQRIPQMHPDEAFPWAAARSAELFASEEASEGMAAYLEKRPPKWAL